MALRGILNSPYYLEGIQQCEASIFMSSGLTDDKRLEHRCTRDLEVESVQVR